MNKVKKAEKFKRSYRGYIPFYGNTKNSENIENTENPENPESAVCPEVNIIPEYIKKTLDFKETDVLHINLKYPVFSVKSNPAAEKKINAFYSSAINSFMAFCEKNLYKSAAEKFLNSQNAQNIQDNQNIQNNQDNYNNINNISEFKPFGAVITFETPYIKLFQNLNFGFICVYLDINIYGGKGRENITRKSQIWNITNGELFSPRRIINFDKYTKNRVCEHICQIMERRIMRGEERYLNADNPFAYRQNVYKHLSIDNLYLAGNGYGFFFPQGTVAPHDGGIIDFTVPERVLYGTE